MNFKLLEPNKPKMWNHALGYWLDKPSSVDSSEYMKDASGNIYRRKETGSEWEPVEVKAKLVDWD
jgi:hypothetical protein